MWPPPPSCSDGKWMPAHLGDQHHLCIPIPSGPRDELCVVSTPLSLHTKMCVRADLARQQTPVAFPTPVSSEDDRGGPRGSEGQDKSVLCVQRPGLARPRPRASSCRAGLSKASCMPKTSQTTLEGLPSWPTEGRQCLYWEQACPPSTGCPNKNPTKETIKDSKLPKKKGRGQGISKPYRLLLGQPGTQVQSRRSPSSLSGPACPLHAKRGTEAQVTEIRARQASTQLCH